MQCYCRDLFCECLSLPTANDWCKSSLSDDGFGICISCESTWNFRSIMFGFCVIHSLVTMCNSCPFAVCILPFANHISYYFTGPQCFNVLHMIQLCCGLSVRQVCLVFASAFIWVIPFSKDFFVGFSF